MIGIEALPAFSNSDRKFRVVEPKSRIFLLNAFARHYDELLRHVARRIGNPAAANDVVQDTFLRVHACAPTAEIASPAAYLFRVADNIAIDHLRHEAVRSRVVSADAECEGVAAPDPSPEHALDYKQRLRALDAAVAELPPKCREVFLLHKFDGLSHGEIAERLGISRSMVEKHVMKALVHCRDRLADLLD
ncbi:RNA polymerase sigma factor [Xanthobacter versatilis]